MRIALGATARNIALIVSVPTFAMAMLGASVGMTLGLASARFVASLLYGVKGTDISMMTLPAVVLLSAVALAAAPAVMRAIRVDPAVMLEVSSKPLNKPELNQRDTPKLSAVIFAPLVTTLYLRTYRLATPRSRNHSAPWGRFGYLQRRRNRSTR